MRESGVAWSGQTRIAAALFGERSRRTSARWIKVAAPSRSPPGLAGGICSAAAARRFSQRASRSRQTPNAFGAGGSQSAFIVFRRLACFPYVAHHYLFGFRYSRVGAPG